MNLSTSPLLSYIKNSLIALIIIYAIGIFEFTVLLEKPLELELFIVPTFAAIILAVMLTKILLLNKQYLLEKELTRAANRENEILLSEVHHRVKNNLQIITSLLGLQARTIQDKKSKSVFQDSQNRIISMAMVHEMLYQESNLGQINYNNYLSRLIAGLIKSIRGPEHLVNLDLDVPEAHFNIDTSIPLGLIINEVITNSLKYGFNDDAIEVITVRIEKLEHPKFILEIGDNGKGFSDNANFNNATSLGLKLINELTLQLNGQVTKDNTKAGTHYVFHLEEIGN
jgi:two-component sensor histidine kinase